MGNTEFMPETVELAEGTEMSGLLEQKEALQGQLEAAQEAGNMEKANFFRGELTRLEDKLTQQNGSEISFGMNRLSAHQG